jgi:hypothetical protein
MFFYETQARLMDSLSREDAILSAKCFLKLYLKQQECLNNIKLSTVLTDFDDYATI